MPPDAPAIHSLCPQIESRVIESHLSRLDADYLERFESDVVAEHLEGLCALSSEHAVQVIVRRRDDAQIECAVLAFDHPFEFSLIAGVLAGTGFTIDSGDVFTLTARAATAASAPRRGPRHRFRRRPIVRDPHHEGVIIDVFTGHLIEPNDGFNTWSDRFTTLIEQAISLLDRGDAASIEKAKQHVNELVTDRLARLDTARAADTMQPVQIETDQLGSDGAARTRLKIVAQDTPAFLYSLCTALSLQGLSIQRVRIDTSGDRVEDEIHVVDARGQPIVETAALERLKLSALLTKQFTYFLGGAPDPYTALTRFEQFTQDILDAPQRGKWMDLLSNAWTMQELAKLLGTSDFLWEDFIRAQYESLLPILEPHTPGQRFFPPTETLPLRMQQAVGGATTLAEQQERLNGFKDREIFLIDLDHILTPGSDFRDMSYRLTMLAEHLVATAARLVYEDLAKTHGEPKDERGVPVPYAVVGLGKLGGIALGYASDIELLFTYGGAGKTAGGTKAALTNAEFFELLTRQTAQFIHTKREGIFEVDLRLRPHGKDGPLACSLEQFRSYYAPGDRGGGPHPFEKLALVRLRWIAGDPPLGFEIERLRDQFVYDRPQLNMDALWEIWAAQRRDKSRPGKLNAKYSPGCLVDLEGTVQLLQVMHASRAPQLRTPRLSTALEALLRARVVTPQAYADLVGAYFFLRRLINALRMLRGNAADLFLPTDDGDELVHLARRMGHESTAKTEPGKALLDEFERRTGSVRQFVEDHFERKPPGG